MVSPSSSSSSPSELVREIDRKYAPANSSSRTHVCNGGSDHNRGFDAETSNDFDSNGGFSGSNVLDGFRECNGENVERASDFSEIDMEIEKREIYIEEEEENQNKNHHNTQEAKASSSIENHHHPSTSSSSSSDREGQEQQLLRPHSKLPQPEVPSGLLRSPSINTTNNNNTTPLDPHQIERSQSFSVNVPSIGKFLRERSHSFSAAIAKGISSLKETTTTTTTTATDPDQNVTEFHLSGLKVIVQLKNDQDKDEFKSEFDFKGRVSFFSRSNCRDCRAVRTFFREKGLKYVEINIDVYPLREQELVQRTGSSSVPQIFFNEKLLGGLGDLNSLRNNGELDQRLKEMLGKRCPDEAPSVPVYGFDDHEEGEEERTDEMIGIVRVLRQRLPIQDRLMRMKLVKNCFAGSEMVEVMIHHLDCGRKKAIAIGKELAKKHFIHHVFGSNDFEDGNHFYRFLEHEAFIPKCFNFRGSTNDSELKPAAVVSQKLTKIMTAILESYASEDRRHLDYLGISNSEEFRRYVNLAQDLQRVDIPSLSADEKLAFFLNLYNAMVIHAVIRVGCPEGVIDRKSFYSDVQYVVGGYAYSLAQIKNGILRSNRRQPYSLVKPFGTGDKRLELSLPKVNPLIHFGLCNGTRSSPKVRFFSPQLIEAELRSAAREFFQGDGIEIDLEKRTVHLSRIINWFIVDFGQEKEMLKWILDYLDATKAGLLTHLLSDGGTISVTYKNYDWSLNS